MTAAGFAVDNSGTATQGRIYAFEEFASGQRLPARRRHRRRMSTFGAQGTTAARRSAPTGISGFRIFLLRRQGVPAQRRNHREDASFPTKPDGTTNMTSRKSCDFAIDSQYNFYVAGNATNGGYVKKYDSNGVFQYRLGTGSANDRRGRPPRRLRLRRRPIHVVEKYSSTGSLLDEFATRGTESRRPVRRRSRKPANASTASPAPGGIAVDESTGDVYVANPQLSRNGSTSSLRRPADDRRRRRHRPTGADPDHRAPARHRGSRRCRDDRLQVRMGRRSFGLRRRSPLRRGRRIQRLGRPACLRRDHRPHPRQHLPCPARRRKRQRRLSRTGWTGSSRRRDKPMFGKVYVNGLEHRRRAPQRRNRSRTAGSTTYHFEYGTGHELRHGRPDRRSDAVSPGGRRPSASSSRASTPGTEYHYRVVATNLAGVSTGADHIFRPSRGYRSFVDECANSLSRQQTGAALLPDCRSYELASSADDSGGYNVESDLVPGQQPFDGPTVDGRLLYGVHDGGIPGTGNPTNHGARPLPGRTRSGSGWTTRYVGIPANGTPSVAPFASTLLATDDAFDTFAFGGSGHLRPLLRRRNRAAFPFEAADGSLVQGMAGSLEPGRGREPDGLIAAPMSADGTAPRLRLDLAVRGRRQRRNRRRLDLRARPRHRRRPRWSRRRRREPTSPASRARAPVTPPATATGSPSSRSPPTAPGSSSPSGSRPTPTATSYWHPYLHVGSDPADRRPRSGQRRAASSSTA